MLTVHSPPIIQPDPEHGWEMVFWLGEAFDYETPFRQGLGNVVEILQQSGSAALALPPHRADEDFVEGSLTFGTATLKTYYEYSLGYLALMSHDRRDLEDVAARVLPFVQVQR